MNKKSYLQSLEPLKLVGKHKVKEVVQEPYDFLKIIMENSTNAIFSIDLNGKFTFVNPRTSEITGYPSIDLIGQHFSILLSKDNLLEANEKFKKAILYKEIVQYYHARLIHRDGSIRIFTFIIVPLIRAGEVIGIVGTAEDITEQKKLEEELQRKSVAMNTAMDGMAILNKHGEIIYLNDAHIKLYGYDHSAELMGKQWRVLYDDKEIRKLEQNVLPILSEQGKWRGEAHGRKKNGTIFSQELSLNLIEGDGLVCVVRDVTESKQAEEALQKALKDSFRQTVQNLQNLIFKIKKDNDGKIIYTLYEGKIAQDLGLTTDNTKGRATSDLFPPEVASYLDEQHQKAFLGEVVQYEVTFANRIFYNTLSPIINGSLVVEVVGTSIDITEFKETQMALLKVDTLSAVGQLAAGVAHEIRNPLTALRGFVQLLNSKKSDDKRHLDIMLCELDRIEFIIKEFLMLAKPHRVAFQKKDLHMMLKHTVDLLNTQAIMNNVQIVTKAEPDIPLIHCEENQLKQVFVNFIKNAIEVMPDGGKLFIKVKLINTKQVLISFVDQGCGITEEGLAKLGEPFFTTKEKGTGLGLMVCYKIIEHHKGKINVESRVGTGTKFDIILPIDQH
jgi:two-component system sporulation sensor kinase A